MSVNVPNRLAHHTVLPRKQMNNLRHLLRRVKPTKSRRASEDRTRGFLSNNRRLLTEMLEQRQLLAGDIGPWLDAEPSVKDVNDYAVAQNYWNKYDVNNDGHVTALDALHVINYMNANPEGEPTGAIRDGVGFVDVNGDNVVTALDSLQVINRLNRAEGAPDYDVRFELTPRNLDDSLIAQDGTYTTDTGATGVRYTVDKDEIFKLEVAVQDDRGRFNSFGVFQAVTDILINETGVLVPAVGEIQGFDFAREVVTQAPPPNSTIEFFYANDPSDVVSASLEDFLGSSDSDTAQFVSDAVVQLSSGTGELNISEDDILVTAAPESSTGPYQIRIEYNSLDLANVDVPRLETRLRLNGVEQSVTTIEQNVMLANGEFNPITLRERFETFMRNDARNVPPNPAINDGLGPLIYGQNSNSGRFHTDVQGNGTDIFTEVRTLGPIGKLTDSISNYDYTTAYDAFSIPVRAVKTASDVGVRLGKSEPRVGFEGVLIYGADDSKSAVPPERVHLDERSEFQLNVTGEDTGELTANNATMAVTEDDAAGDTIQLQVTGALPGETITFDVPPRQGALGTATIDAGGVMTYIPDANKFGTDLVVYTATTPSGGTATATVTVNIDAVNDSPVAYDDPDSGTLSVDAGSSILIDVLANDDAGGDFSEPISELTITAGSLAPTLGAIAIEGDKIRYTPTPGAASGTDTFTYTITDAGGLSDSATVTVSVVNNASGISASDKSITIAEDNGGEITSEVLVADLSADGLITVNSGDTNISLDSATGPADRGTVRIDGDQIFYTPKQDDNGPVSITYTASNNAGTDSGTIFVDITPVNDQPVAPPLQFDVNEMATRTINVLLPGGGQTGPSDVETPTSDLIVTLPAQTFSPLGTVSVVNNQLVVKSLGTADQGGFSFQYRVTDADGAVSDNGTITIDIVDVLNPPVAGDQNVPAVDEDSGDVTVDLSALTTSEAGSVVYTVDSTSVPADQLGVATIDGSDLVFALKQDANGTGTLVYRATDAAGYSLGTLTFTVNPVNDAPVLGQISDSVAENSSIDIDVAGMATDVDSTDLTAAVVTDPANGTAVLLPSGLIQYTPNADYTGPDSFRVSVSDGIAPPVEAQVTILVTEVVAPPVATDGTLTVDEDAAATTLDLKPLVTSDATATITLVGSASHGTATITNGVLSYQPAANYFGVDSITYEATSSAGSDTGVIAITVNAVNDAPIASDDTVVVTANTAKEIDVLANDTPNPGGESDTVTLSIEAGDGPAHGTVSVTNNVVTYTPDDDFVGTDSFVYTLSDGQGGVDTATVSITVNEIANNAPIANNDTAVVTKNTAKVIHVLGNDTPNPGGETDTVTLSIATGDEPAHGTVSISNNVLTYTPETGFVGTDSFVYTLSDDKGASDTATVSITVEDTAVVGSEVSGQIYLDSISNLGDVVLNDAAPIRSGSFESGETTLVGVRVHLKGVAGTPTASTAWTVVTDRDGRYTFDNVPPGSYEIHYDLPEGMKVAGEGVDGIIPITIPDGEQVPMDVSADFVIEDLGDKYYAGRNILTTDPNREGLPPTVTVGETSSFFFTESDDNTLVQNTVLVGRDFGDARFIELLMNQNRDEALLVIVHDDLRTQTAAIDADHLAVLDSGSDVRVDLFGGTNDFVFTDIDDMTDITTLYPEYQDAIEELLNSF